MHHPLVAELHLKCDFLLFKTHLPVVTQSGIRGQPSIEAPSVRVDVSSAVCLFPQLAGRTSSLKLPHEFSPLPPVSLDAGDVLHRV